MTNPSPSSETARSNGIVGCKWINALDCFRLDQYVGHAELKRLMAPGAVPTVELFDKLGALPGFAVLERRNPLDPTTPRGKDRYVYDGIIYTIRQCKILNDIFEISPSELMFAFTKGPGGFLPALGFTNVSQPKNGDVAIYFDVKLGLGTNSPLEQCGIVQDGKIRSKWGIGHVCLHPVNGVIGYGEGVWFFRPPLSSDIIGIKGEEKWPGEVNLTFIRRAVQQ